jgi:hypothetical protein
LELIDLNRATQPEAKARATLARFR